MNSLSTVKTELTVPELAVLGATRGMLGAGLALLLAHKLSPEKRQAIGWTLAAIGVATSIPLAILVFGQRMHDGAD